MAAYVNEGVDWISLSFRFVVSFQQVDSITLLSSQLNDLVWRVLRVTEMFSMQNET